MNIQLISAGNLDSGHLAAWSRIQQGHSELASPLFRAEFTRLAAEACRGIEVAVVQEDGAAVGFFPFHRDPWNVARPVGGCLSDVHGLIAPQDVALDVRELIRGCELRAWYFDHLPAWQAAFTHCGWGWAQGAVPFMDLSAGFDGYATRRRRTRNDPLPQVMHKSRRMQREIGHVRFSADTEESEALDHLIDWRAQASTRCRPPARWQIELLRRVARARCNDFAGLVSTLHVGGRPAAVHVGIRSARVLHSWLAGHDPRLRRYLPELILLLEIARRAEHLDIDRIDLGGGSDANKMRLMSDALPLVAGAVDLRRVTGTVRRTWARTRAWLHASVLGAAGGNGFPSTAPRLRTG